MDRNKKNPTDTETILMALDQISQTIDVMTNVVARLRNYVQQHASAVEPAKKQEEDSPGNHVIH